MKKNIKLLFLFMVFVALIRFVPSFCMKEKKISRLVEESKIIVMSLHCKTTGKTLKNCCKESVIIKEIKNEKEHIKMVADANALERYDKVYQVILNALERNVKVEIIFSDNCRFKHYCRKKEKMKKQLNERSADVFSYEVCGERCGNCKRKKTFDGTMHSKFIIFDETVPLYGSYNFLKK